MEGFAHINGVGLITRATEGKTGAGKPKVALGVKVEWTERSRTDESKSFTKTMFLTVEMYGADAERYRADWLKGKMLAFDGQISQREFEDPETGAMKTGWTLGGFPTLIPFAADADTGRPAWQGGAPAGRPYTPGSDFDEPGPPED